MSKQVTPYSTLPDHCFWSRSHSNKDLSDIDPVVKGHFKLDPSWKIATAGSCFAQHIARHLKDADFGYFVAEPAHPVISDSVARQFNYGTFSARYGNIYTARQLLQLAKRARGTFVPQDDKWISESGYRIDPFRPNIQPDGFASDADFEGDRRTHFAAVRRIMDESDVFIFTFGLTEAWRAKADDAIYPLAPGVAGGMFDAEKHEFVNFSVSETVADFKEFVELLRETNPNCRILMTVSPVPLIATARADQSVITATMYSKSVLRVACEELQASVENCFYFPSYEVVTGNHARGAYFAPNLRDVENAGVQHVMSLFMRHYTDNDASTTGVRNARLAKDSLKKLSFQQEIESALDVICDEELIDKSVKKPAPNTVAVEKTPANKEMVVGLYSYPKSGNTWLRAIFAAISGMPETPGALQRYVTDSHYAKVIEHPWRFQGTDWYFYKSHHKQILTEHMDQVFETDKVVYIYRHPLDVFISYLNFISNNVSPQAGASLKISFDRVEDLSPEDMEKLFSIFLEHGTLFPQNHMFGSVFESIASFEALSQTTGRVHILRYEDLQDDFHVEIKKLCDFVGFKNIDTYKVFAMADKRTNQNGKFFWKRQKENYKNYLSDDQIRRFNDTYKVELARLGYVS